ncbi:MAG: hypothetical protein QOE55_8318 [Acidobacteriaceae bacterium]|jgi:hypothetical protein|nr:hypothetical protein [Acidobacteriaceae bacterium]
MDTQTLISYLGRATKIHHAAERSTIQGRPAGRKKERPNSALLDPRRSAEEGGADARAHAGRRIHDATAYVEPLAVLTLVYEPGPKWKQASR